MAKHSILFISLLFIVSVVALTSAQSNSQNNCHSKKCIRNNRNKEFADINASNERFNKQSNLTGILTKYKQNLKEYKRLQVQSMRQKIKTLENTIKLQEQNFTRCKDSLMQKDMEISKKENDFVAELQSDIDQKELEISKLKKNISIIQSALDNQNNTFKNIIRMKDNDYAILHNSYVVLQNRIDYKDYEINMTRGQLQRKELMITELQKQIQLSNTEMNRMLSNNKTLSTQLENCTNEIFKLKADSSDILDIIPEISVPVATTSSPIYVKVDSVFRPMDSDNCPPFGNYLGSHLVRLPGKQPFSIPCNSDSTNKVWSVIQRRLHQTLSFNRDWKAYREGFGDHKSEFFIGLEKIHLMTSSQPHELFIRLRSRQAVKTALYSHFEIAGEDEDYALISLGKYSGDAGDGMRGKVGQKFSTFDRDNDLLGDTNCAEDSEGAWWFSDCGVTNLNFKFYGKNSIAVLWNNFLDFSGVSIEMMIRAT